MTIVRAQNVEHIRLGASNTSEDVLTWPTAFRQICVNAVRLRSIDHRTSFGRPANFLYKYLKRFQQQQQNATAAPIDWAGQIQIAEQVKQTFKLQQRW